MTLKELLEKKEISVKSHMCHKLKEEGDLGFIIKTLEQDVNLATALGDKSAAKVALKNAIPEFKRFNIIEGDIRDAV